MTAMHNRGMYVAAAVALVAAGMAVGAAVWRRPAPRATVASAPAADVMPVPARDAVVTLSAEMAARAGIRTVAASLGTAPSRLGLPGVVEANRYREVTVTSLVSGRLTSVSAALGQHVVRGQELASVYSPELADAQAGYVATHAELLGHEQRLTRTRRLAEIGAASRQELEMLEADHARLEASVEAARSRLELLGVARERIDVLAMAHKATTDASIVAPIDGIVSARSGNPGLNIDPSMPLFTILDLSSVWVIADLYERDFAAVPVGTRVQIATPAYPGVLTPGTVSYIDPQMQTETRTAKLRVEVPNPGGRLRLGMYVDVGVDLGAKADAVLVPRSALQTVGERQVVYVADPDQQGRFIERQVEVDDTGRDRVVVIRGVAVGEQVVSEGGFFVRAELGRMTGH